MSDAQNDHVRLFVALPLPDSLKSTMKTDMGQLREQYSFQKWVHPQDLHLTLVFLGATAVSSIAAITARLQEAAANRRSFALRLREAGVFGPPHSPRVLWAGVQGELDALKGLQADVSGRLQTLGFAPEERGYSPHLTVARQYTGSGAIPKDALTAAFQGGDLQWTVNRLALYRSHLGRLPMYEELDSVPFSG